MWQWFNAYGFFMTDLYTVMYSFLNCQLLLLLQLIVKTHSFYTHFLEF